MTRSAPPPDTSAHASVPRLVASCWTSAGDTAPGRPDERSPFAFEDRVRAIADTGWQGLGLWHADLLEIDRTIGFEAAGALLADAGLGIVEVEFLADWWTDGAVRADSDRRRELLFRAASPLGVRHVKTGLGMGGAVPDRDVLLRQFRRLAAEAADAGLLIALEPSPFSNLPTLRDGVEFVAEADHPHAGLMVDTWHVVRGGTRYAELPALLPVELVFGVELDDGRRTPRGPAFEDTIHNRMFCGEGEFDVPSFIATLLRIGYAGAWGVEIISDELRAMPLTDGLRRARAATLDCFRAASGGALPPAGGR